MTRVAKDNKSHTVRCVVTLSRYEVSQWLDPHHIDAVNTIRWRSVLRTCRQGGLRSCLNGKLFFHESPADQRRVPRSVGRIDTQRGRNVLLVAYVSPRIMLAEDLPCSHEARH
jgi:hypothetical protein